MTGEGIAFVGMFLITLYMVAILIFLWVIWNEDDIGRK